MGFLDSFVSGVVKVALTPIAMIKDAASILSDEDPDATKKLLESAIKDLTGENE